MQGVQRNSTLLQKMNYYKQTFSSVSHVECYVCGKGLADGHTITAKTLPTGVVLFCDVHYPLQ